MDRYEQCVKELRLLIPPEEYRTVLSQDYCELEHNFLGFVDIYKSLSEIIPKCTTVIDFGCYLAAQSYFFQAHKRYIGVDVVDMQRFTPRNAVHYVGTIQSYLQDEVPKLLEDHDIMEYFAICSHVPDFKATSLVCKIFPGCFCYYPYFSMRQ